MNGFRAFCIKRQGTYILKSVNIVGKFTSDKSE